MSHGNNINTGGPAFPAPDLGKEHFSQRGAYPGMTLRDYFAAHAPAQRTDFTEQSAAAIVGRDMPTNRE